MTESDLFFVRFLGLDGLSSSLSLRVRIGIDALGSGLTTGLDTSRAVLECESIGAVGI